MRYDCLLCWLGLFFGCSGMITPSESDSSATELDATATEVDAGAGEREPVVAPTNDAARETETEAAVMAQPLRWAASERFADYLTDAVGRALYMLIDDVPHGETSACVGACARDWPPLDLSDEELASAALPVGIERSALTRFHRQDGAWQLRYHGHPLYYRAIEHIALAPHEVTGDGVDGRWFVARDYLVFLSTTSSFDPAGASDMRRAYLTDGFGRTLYVCLDDTRASASTPPVSLCLGDCLANRPPWDTSRAIRTSRIPSSLVPAELVAFVRPDGIGQLSFRGWPLYFFRGDALAGDTVGHNQGAWRAIDPIAFSLDETD